jgi:hypothetical protein
LEGGKKWLLHHNNVPVHSPLLICDFLTRCETMLILCTLYSLDLAPAYFHFFTKLKSLIKGWWFESVKEIKENLLTELHIIPKEVYQ